VSDCRVWGGYSELQCHRKHDPVDIDSELATVIRRHSAAAADANTDPWEIEILTDIRNFVNDADIEAITWEPGDLAQAHTYDEHIELANAATGLATLFGAVHELLENRSVTGKSRP
jgi:succinyl-diaminopimelate desuccinylase